GRHVAVDDALPDRVAVAAARRDAEKRRPKPDRLTAIDGGGLLEEEAAEPAPRRLAFRLCERLAADESALLQRDGEAEPGLVGRVVGRDVGAPVEVAFLEPQRVDRTVA